MNSLIRRHTQRGGKRRVCQDCCWIYKWPHKHADIACPLCGGPSAGAYWMFYKASYEFERTQGPWLRHVLEQAWDKHNEVMG